MFFAAKVKCVNIFTNNKKNVINKNKLLRYANRCCRKQEVKTINFDTSRMWYFVNRVCEYEKQNINKQHVQQFGIRIYYFCKRK